MTADQDTETTIREVSEEAIRMAKDMVAVEKGRGFDGDFQVTVSVSVKIEKIVKK